MREKLEILMFLYNKIISPCVLLMWKKVPYPQFPRAQGSRKTNQVLIRKVLTVLKTFRKMITEKNLTQLSSRDNLIKSILRFTGNSCWDRQLGSSVQSEEIKNESPADSQLCHHSRPIRGQCPGHLITLDQSEASIQVTWSPKHTPDCAITPSN